MHVRYKITTWLRGFIDSPLMRAPMPLSRVEEMERLADLLNPAGPSVRSAEEIGAFSQRIASDDLAGPRGLRASAALPLA